MAKKKTPTKKQKLRKQYREQIRRIERNYRNIEARGGSFSETLDDIIKPVKNPTEATIRRLKQISKDDLYKKAKTETGESGWKLRLKRDRYAQFKSKITKDYKTKFTETEGIIDGIGYSDFEGWRRAYENKQHEEFEQWKEEVQREAEAYQEPEEPYQWVKEEPEPEEPEPPEAIDFYDETTEDYEPDYAGEREPDTPFPFTPDSVGGDDAFYFAIEDHILFILSENQDSQFMRGLKEQFDEMRDNMTPEEFRQWLEENQEEFIDTIEEVIKYSPSVVPTGEGLQKFTKAINMMTDGITPLDQYYQPDEYNDEEEYDEETDEEDEDEYEDILDQVTGEVIKGRQKTFLQRIDKWGKAHYNTVWVDESGLTLDVGYKTSHYIPISQIRNIEDYLK